MIVLVPVVWGLPISLMTAELAAAIPAEGGYYVWVKRAMGPFWGFTCAWLSWLYSIVDAALYPLLFAQYAKTSLKVLAGIELSQWHTAGIAIGLILFVTFLNLKGIKTVGNTSVLLGITILLPFIYIVIRHGIHLPKLPPLQLTTVGLSIGLATALWNYLGWDNLSTVSGEIEEPQRSFPIAMLVAIPLVTLGYLLPVLSVLPQNTQADLWQDGSWPNLVTRAAGPRLGTIVLVGGLASACAMFVSQMLASSRIPAVLAEDGYLPRGLSLIDGKSMTPIRSILFCACLYACFSWFSFSELITANALLYGLSICLEMIALIVLRVKEPQLERPFKIPGGIPVLVIMAALPAGLMLLLSVATVQEEGWLKQIPSVLAIFIGLAIYRFTSDYRRA